ncbi:hypothetical protein Pfo_013929 [Paulownia fortunei]|nr:hypothetical protein Pfo_013929 [Paulownia fortunei]
MGKVIKELIAVKDRLEREISSGKKFINLKVGKTCLANVKERAIFEFKALSSFDDVVMERPICIYDLTIYWDTSCISIEDFMLLDHSMPDLDEDGVLIKSYPQHSSNSYDMNVIRETELNLGSSMRMEEDAYLGQPPHISTSNKACKTSYVIYSMTASIGRAPSAGTFCTGITRT